MLNNYNLSEQIRECLRHAEDCAQKAAAQSDPQLKQDFLDMERRWLFLARSHGFTERLTKLSNETKRHTAEATAGSNRGNEAVHNFFVESGLRQKSLGKPAQ
jgi:hypothetical protein